MKSIGLRLFNRVENTAQKTAAGIPEGFHLGSLHFNGKLFLITQEMP